MRDDNALPPPVVIPPPRQLTRSRRRRRTLISLLVVLLLGLGAGYAGWWFATGRYARVPNLTSASRVDAISKLEDAGFKVQVQPGPEFSAQVAKNLVLRTVPAAGSRVVRGKTVTIVLSAGPQLFTVPQVRKKSVEDARTQLAAVADPPLTVAQDVKQEPSDTVPAGEVTRTDPAAGQKVTADQTITIYVSTGPPVVDVPSIAANTPFADARRTLTRSDGQFKVDRVGEYSDSVPKGDVISIDPSDQAVKFSTITVTVSKGPEFVTIPDIPAGTSQADARAQLEQLGLVPEFHQIGNRPDPVVFSVDGVGSTVHVGTTVIVTLI